MRPTSVAVLGASPRVGSHGNAVVRNLLNFGFRGRIYPVHPSAKVVEGLMCFASLDDVPETPDCIVVALSAEKVLPALTEASTKHGVRAAVVFASGFSEVGARGMALQHALRDLCDRTGLLLCGPNCLGLANLHDRIPLYSAGLPETLKPGEIAVASHSGSGCIALSGVGRFGVSHLVSVGNAVALDIADYLEFFARDERTRAAALFMESVRTPERFAHAAAQMRAAGKPIVVLKVGRSEKGAAATAAHTGSLAGSDEVYADFFRSIGVSAVDDIDELVECCTMFASPMRRPAGRGVAVVNVSGGEVALTCDLAKRVDISLPDLQPQTIELLRTALPDFATPSNPLDATGSAVSDMRMYRQCIDALASDPLVSVLAVSQDCPVGISAATVDISRAIAETTAAAALQCDKPIVFYSNVGGGLHPEAIAPLEGSGVPALQGARPALLAIKRFIEWHQWQPMQPSLSAKVKQYSRAWHERLRTGTPLTEREAKKFLSEHGIRVTREALAGTARQAATLAADIGFPVVLKIESPDIAHKTEAGGVRLSLNSEAEVMTAFGEVISSVKRHAPQARINGVVIQEMICGGIELIAGASRQDPFGYAIVVGSGGVLVELLHDSALALTPVTEQRAGELIRSTRASKLLSGFRGRAPADIAAFEALVVRLSEICIAYSDAIQAVDLNPVSVLEDGAGVRVLDALILLNPATSTFENQETK
ncbi:acetate--CoA ligase family protein [Caballeronia sp. SBC2]|uniref:acetate--CoA ligase family protein n=1 Tax=Caballeronia sp. SBC2 TaxID=2705547 RepID=UPI001F14E8CE|nr:acetate--CoA ligase family protein [Caballeronia sp. SBC2]